MDLLLVSLNNLSRLWELPLVVWYLTWMSLRQLYNGPEYKNLIKQIVGGWTLD